MVLGIDDAVGIAALSLTCFIGCFKGLLVISKARHFTRDVSDVRLQIELSLQSLFTWAEEAGLTHEPPSLLVSASHAMLVLDILRQISQLVLDLNHLKEKYGLHLSSYSGDVESLDDEDSTLSKLGLKQQEYTTRADIAVFRKRKEPWKRLQWVTLDDKRAANLLEKINIFIGELGRFLEQSKQARRDRYLEVAYRDAVLNTEGQQQLHILEQEYERKAASANVAIAAAARLKQTRLRLRLDEDSPLIASGSSGPNGQCQDGPENRPRSSRPVGSESPPVSLDSMRLRIRTLTLPRLARVPGLLRSLAFYDKSAILLEWKSGPRLGDAKILDRRVSQVAAFLHEIEPSFHSLPCRGFVKDHEANRYGYVFDLPESLSASNPLLGQPSIRPSQPVLPEMHSLRKMLDQTGQTPSLNSRLRLSVIILETILNLHTSGWLHKELRSANVILIRQASCADAPLDLSSYETYVAGYTYARADNPDELTEPLASSTEVDVYRHPSSLGDSRRPFSKTFDLFSVGCTLLEIGLWKNLRQILICHAPSALSSKRDDKDFKPDYMQLRHEVLLLPLGLAQNSSSGTKDKEPSGANNPPCNILRSLEAAMGIAYTSIVKELLSAAEHASTTSEDASVDHHASVLDLEIRAKHVVQAIANIV